MSTNRLPTREDGYRMSVRFKDRFGNQEFLLFPLDWGAARVADLIDETKVEAGIRYIRYDLPISSYSNNSSRPVTKSGTKVHHDLENGRTLINSTNGPVYVPIQPVDFNISREAVFLEDWLGFTGQALRGGIIWGVYNRNTLNLRKIYPAALEAFRNLELPQRYGRRNYPLGELILPYDQYPLVSSFRRHAMVVNHG